MNERDIAQPARAGGDAPTPTIPVGFKLVKIERLEAIAKHAGDPSQRAYLGRNLYDDQKVLWNWEMCRDQLQEVQNEITAIQEGWDAEELDAALAAAPQAAAASVVGLGESHIAVLANVDQPVAVAAPQAQEVEAALINLGIDGGEHHLQPAGSALPHDAPPVMATQCGTAALQAAASTVPATSNLVPGQMRCARCKFQLTRSVLYMGSGTVGAGDSKTEPCPNGCGPLWPVTWEEAARDAWATCEQMFDRARAAEEKLAAVAGPRLVEPEAAPAAVGAVPATSVEQAVDEFLADYEMVGEDAEGRTGYYQPTADELIVIKDAIMGLMADDGWLAAYGRAPTATPAAAEREAELWRQHAGKLDALVTYCPTCCEGFAAKKELTRDEVIFECGRTAGRAPLRNALALAVDHIDMAALRISHCKDAAAIDAALGIGSSKEGCSL